MITNHSAKAVMALQDLNIFLIFFELLKNPLNEYADVQDPRLPAIVTEAVNGGYQGVKAGAGVLVEKEITILLAMTAFILLLILQLLC